MTDEILREELNEAVARWDGFVRRHDGLWARGHERARALPDYLADTSESQSAAWRLLVELSECHDSIPSLIRPKPMSSDWKVEFYTEHLEFRSSYGDSPQEAVYRAAGAAGLLPRGEKDAG